MNSTLCSTPIWKQPNPLFIGDIPEEVDTVVLLGNGIWKNGWSQLESFRYSFKKHWPLNAVLQNLPIDHALTLLAIHFTEIRFDICRKLLAPNCPELEQDYSTIDKLHKILQELCSLIKISDMIANQEAKSKLDKIISAKEKIGIITLNWDCATSVLFGHDIPIIHLHGHVHHPGTIILPAQTVMEYESLMQVASLQRNNQRYNRCHCKNKLKLERALNPDDRCAGYLRRAQLHASNWIRRSLQIIVCGVGFNEYDHEFLWTLEQAKFLSKIYGELPFKEKESTLLIDQKENFLKNDKNKKEDIIKALFGSFPTQIAV